MARRIEIELTSARPDGTWTWRAAGAKQPKGVLEGSVLYEGARVGDVVRADAEFELDGIIVTSVIPPKGARVEPQRLEIIGPPREPAPLVTSSAPMREERDRGPRGPRREGDRGPRREGDRDRRPPRSDRPDRAAGGPPRERRDRPDGGTRPARPRREPVAREEPAPKPKPKRLNPGRRHRDAVLAALPDEQRPIAEQVLRGGVQVVRQAVEQENAKATAEGRPEVKAEALVALAEELLPRLRLAEWHDRAEAAAASVDEISLRDLRSVVASGDVAKDDETRALAAQLREGLERRLATQREDWVAEVSRSLDDGRVVRALRVAGRPPEPGTRFPAELSTRLSEAAGAAMAPETTPDRWTALLDAVASSPVRRSVKPAGLPADPGEDLLTAAKKAAARVPALGPLLGIDPPRPPAPPRRPGASRLAPPRPPAPPRAAPAPAAATEPVASASPPPEVASQPPMSAPTPIGVDAGPEPAATAVVVTAEGEVPVENVAVGDLTGATDGDTEPEVGVAPAPEHADEMVGAEPDAPAPEEGAAPFIAEEHPAERAAEEISPDTGVPPGD